MQAKRASFCLSPAKLRWNKFKPGLNSWVQESMFPINTYKYFCCRVWEPHFEKHRGINKIVPYKAQWLTQINQSLRVLGSCWQSKVPWVCQVWCQASPLLQHATQVDPKDQLPCLTWGVVSRSGWAHVAPPLAPPSVTRLEKSKATPTAGNILTQSLKRLSVH